MAEVTIKDVIESEKYNKFIYKIGYLNHLIFRDLEMLEMYQDLKENTSYYKYEIYDIIGKKYGLSSVSVKRIIRDLEKW